MSNLKSGCQNIAKCIFSWINMAKGGNLSPKKRLMLFKNYIVESHFCPNSVSTLRGSYGRIYRAGRGVGSGCSFWCAHKWPLLRCPFSKRCLPEDLSSAITVSPRCLYDISCGGLLTILRASLRDAGMKILVKVFRKSL